MIREPFANGNSFIHGLDPRIKVVVVTLFSFLVGLSTELIVLSAALGLALFCVGFAGLFRQKELFSRLYQINKLVILCWLLIPWTFEGDLIDPSYWLPVTWQGVEFSTQLSIRLNAIMLMFTALVATESVVTLGHALNSLKVPPKLVHLLLITYRYLFLLEHEYLRLRNALKARGFQPKTNVHTYRSLANLFGMLLVHSMNRATRVHQAMLARGFNGTFYSLDSFGSSPKDWLWAGAMIFVLIFFGVLEWSIL